MPSYTGPYYDSDEEFTSPKDGYSGRHEEHPQGEEKRTTATQRKHFEHISESASMEHEVEDYGQTPLLPPTYSDATAGKAHTSPQAKKSFSGNNTDSNNDVNGRRELPISDAVPLYSENPNRSWQRSEYYSTNRSKAVLKFVIILASLVFIVLAIKSLCHRNVCIPLPLQRMSTHMIRRNQNFISTMVRASLAGRLVLEVRTRTMQLMSSSNPLNSLSFNRCEV